MNFTAAVTVNSTNGSTECTGCVLLVTSTEITFDPETTLPLDPLEKSIQPLISQEVKKITEYIFQISLFIITSIIGMVVNVINITVYWKQGLRESISVGFFALSISDLCIVTFPLVVSTCYLAEIFFPDAPVVFISFHYITTHWLRKTVYSFSCLVTSLLSLERCCCVIFPFKVRQIFTRNRMLAIIFAMVVFHILCNVPIFLSHELRWMPDPRRNGSEILRVWLGSNRDTYEAFHFITISILIPTVCQVVIIGCAIIMINGLRASSKFRQAATKIQYKVDDGGKKSKSAGKDRENNSGKDFSTRDARLIKGMVFLVVILTTCNVPYLALIYAILTVAELDLGRAYHNMYSFMFGISFVLATLNASLNIFVYYNTSSKYKHIFQETFSCRKKPTTTMDNSAPVHSQVTETTENYI